MLGPAVNRQPGLVEQSSAAKNNLAGWLAGWLKLAGWLAQAGWLGLTRAGWLPDAGWVAGRWPAAF